MGSTRAEVLNDRLTTAAPEVLAMLSELGRELFFPGGLLAQGAEARRKGTRANASIGIAIEGGEPMFLPAIDRFLRDLEPSAVYPYSPPAGRPRLRELWRERLLAGNPSLAGKAFSQPMVVSAITNGLALIGDLFLAPGDLVLLPDKHWGNYHLTWDLRRGSTFSTYPLFEGSGLAVEAFGQTLREAAGDRDKVVVLLNFPNNPTGYMPTVAEADAIVGTLVERAGNGTKLVVVLDDAYSGLHYHLGGESLAESLFGRLVGRHPNLLAIKIDGVTKELFAWGLRCGFVTFGPGKPTTAADVSAVLEEKLRGAIRATISSSPTLSQSLVERALQSPDLGAELLRREETLRSRAKLAWEVVRRPSYRPSFEPYPFNSGYFLCVRVHGVDAERLRRHLLDRYGIGLISTAPTDIRIAFSCLELDEIEPVFEALHQAIQELCAAQLSSASP